MEEVVLFLLSFLFVFLIYQLFIVIPTKRKMKKNKKNFRNPFEIMYLLKKYKLDMKKIEYNQLLQIVALVSSFDIALVVTIVLLIDNFILELVLGFILIILVIVASYHLVYLFYKKKGMICNE